MSRVAVNATPPAGFAVVGDQGAEECLVCDCNWFEPADGACSCGHSVADHAEVKDEDDEDS